MSSSFSKSTLAFPNHECHHRSDAASPTGVPRAAHRHPANNNPDRHPLPPGRVRQGAPPVYRRECSLISPNTEPVPHRVVQRRRVRGLRRVEQGDARGHGDARALGGDDGPPLQVGRHPRGRAAQARRRVQLRHARRAHTRRCHHHRREVCRCQAVWRPAATPDAAASWRHALSLADGVREARPVPDTHLPPRVGAGRRVPQAAPAGLAASLHRAALRAAAVRLVHDLRRVSSNDAFTQQQQQADCVPTPPHTPARPESHRTNDHCTQDNRRSRNRHSRTALHLFRDPAPRAHSVGGPRRLDGRVAAQGRLRRVRHHARQAPDDARGVGRVDDHAVLDAADEPPVAARLHAERAGDPQDPPGHALGRLVAARQHRSRLPRRPRLGAEPARASERVHADGRDAGVAAAVHADDGDGADAHAGDQGAAGGQPL